MLTNPLLKLGNIPITTSVLETCFQDLKSPEKKIQALEHDGQIIRLKRGLYVVNPQLNGKLVDVGLCANHIYGPSYVSLQWALRFYGLIPERVYTMTSVTTKHSRKFVNSLGNFTYLCANPEYFAIGLRTQESEGTFYMMATPEKALCDTILHDLYVPSNSLKALAIYLEEDIRFDMEAIRDFDIEIIRQCSQTANKKSSTLENLIKLLQK